MAEDDGTAALDPTDPDAIAAAPPGKVLDAKTWFQVGEHEGKWSEYDDRGVPAKNMKKKKPTKKEKEVLEAEYLDASKAYQKYMKDVEAWEQSKLDSEKALKKSDRLRWSFRQVGQKHDPIEPDEMETIIKFMGWKSLGLKEFKVIKKGLTEIANESGQIDLESLRVYVREVMPIQLLQERLSTDRLDTIELEDLYSPRSWRKKLEEDPPPSKKKKSPRAGGGTSDRGGGGGGGGTSARGSAKKGAKKDDGKAATSPRGNSAPSPRGGKAKKKPGKVSAEK